MPGSQEMNSLDIAYFLYSWRWFFRIVFALMILAGSKQAFQSSKWLPAAALLMAGAIAYGSNYKMAADNMFIIIRYATVWAALPIMVTYCTVCRTGRVFEPLINGNT
ncbi:MAG: hypothetical protein Q8M83_01435 [bacterium]|nr:hypothetical protein [bacterium]